MKLIAEVLITALRAASLAVLLLLPQMSLAQDQIGQEDPSALAMVSDAVLVRPMGLVFTVIGAAVFVVTLPFSALGGNVGQAGKTLVGGPFETTFIRCLGCTKTGYNHEASTADDDVAEAPLVE
jgi:hypothetical protein